MFNRLTWPRKMAEYMSDTGCEVILVDNNSTYPPLLEWYKSCPYKVHRLNDNLGNYSLWISGVLDQYPSLGYYFASDPDLGLSGVPSSYYSIMRDELDAHPEIYKIGLSLEILDLPDISTTPTIMELESVFWKETVGPNGFYKADVDTTFALYDRRRPIGNIWLALRAPRPYTAKHLPWYTSKNDWNEEDIYYYEHITKSSIYSGLIKDSV